MLENLVYEKTQVHSRSVDLTVKSISRITAAGSLDFGGSEFSPGERDVCVPKKIDPADKYGWWFLAAGDYLVEYNEKLLLPADHVAVIQPHERLMESGVTHGTRFITERGEKLVSLMQATQPDVRIKENARISKLIVLQYA